MSLLNKFLGLGRPNTDSLKLFNALSLDQYPFAKIGINNLGYPVILIHSVIDRTHLSQKNVKLKYLELTHNLECRVSEKGDTRIDQFSVIVFRSNEIEFQTYFLNIAEFLLQSLSGNPTQKEIYNKFQRFVDVFQSLSNTPSKTLQGLWSELFLIERSKIPDTLLDYWHIKPEEKFDFNADSEKLEVKSCSTMERSHIFSSEQLNPPYDKQVLIASVFARQSTNGKSIVDLLESILKKLTKPSLGEKLVTLVSKTLGSSVEQSIRIKYDYRLALDSLRFYRHQDISKIECLSIPDRVSEVKYRSNLTDIVSINPNKIKSEGQLFKAI